MDSGAGAYPGGDDDNGHMISGINVTPLVDITLVLLIIFMVTATYIVSPSIKVDLPRAASGSDQTKTTLLLTLGKDGSQHLNGQAADDDAVVRFIGATLPNNPDLQAVIAADRVVPHGRVVHLIDVVKRAGVKRFAINVEPQAATPGQPESRPESPPESPPPPPVPTAP